MLEKVIVGVIDSGISDQDNSHLRAICQVRYRGNWTINTASNLSDLKNKGPLEDYQLLIVHKRDVGFHDEPDVKEICEFMQKPRNVVLITHWDEAEEKSEDDMGEYKATVYGTSIPLSRGMSYSEFVVRIIKEQLKIKDRIK